jgi:hypothetical protein
MHCGLWISDCGLGGAKRDTVAAPIRNPQSAIRNRLASALTLAAIVLASTCPPVFAQGIDVTATLDITNGLARPGAYVPVTLKITNGTNEQVREVRINSGSPVEVAAPCDVSAGGQGGMVLPIFYSGGDLALRIEFVVAGGSRTIRAQVTPAAVRPVEADAATIGVDSDLPDPDEALQGQLRQLLGAKSLNILRLTTSRRGLVGQCGLLDAIIIDSAIRERGGRSVVVNLALPASKVAPSLFPPNTLETVQPEAYRLFGAKVWPTEDRRRLWLWLSLFCLAVGVVGSLVSRRRASTVAATLVALAVGTTALIGFFGDVRMSHVREARVFYARQDAALAGLEHFALMQSRGSKTVHYRCHLPFVHISSGPVEKGVSAVPQGSLPLPLLASADDLFRPLCALQCGHVFESHAIPVPPLPKVAPLDTVKKAIDDMNSRVEFDAARRVIESEVQTTQPLVLLHSFSKEEPPYHSGPHGFTVAELVTLAGRSDLVAALLVEGDRGKDAAGKTQSLDAWAVEWQASTDPDVAFAGRSLAWWKKDRQEGEGPWILSWWHDPLPAGEASKNHERLPALVVDSSASKP